LGDKETCSRPRPVREILDLDINIFPEVSGAAADQTLRKGGEWASGPVCEAQAPGLGRVTLEGRQFRFRVQFAHLNMNVVFNQF
jgi:hypothetical protein